MHMLKNVRLSFPSIWKPTAYEGAEPKYSAVFLIEKNSEGHKALVAHMREVAKAQWGEKAKAILERQDMDSNRQLLKDGDGQKGFTQDGEPKDGYAGHVFIKASNKQQPKIVGRGRQPLTEDDGIPYGGCYVNAQISIWAQDNKFGKFLNCKLLALQFWADGDRFGSADVANVDAFEEAEEVTEDW